LSDSFSDAALAITRNSRLKRIALLVVYDDGHYMRNTIRLAAHRCNDPVVETLIINPKRLKMGGNLYRPLQQPLHGCFGGIADRVAFCHPQIAIHL
jgi:hypothetical protein